MKQKAKQTTQQDKMERNTHEAWKTHYTKHIMEMIHSKSRSFELAWLKTDKEDRGEEHTYNESGNKHRWMWLADD